MGAPWHPEAQIGRKRRMNLAFAVAGSGRWPQGPERIPSRGVLIYTESRSDDVDQVRTRLSQGGWQADLLQLSPGGLGYRGQQVRLPGLHVLWFRYGRQRIELREAKNDGWVSLGTILEGSAPMRMDGSEVAPGRLITRAAGAEHEFLIAPETSSLNIDVAPDLVGCLRGPLGVVATPEPLRRELVAACRALTEVCRTDRSSGEVPVETPVSEARERVLDAVQSLLQGGLRPAAPRAAERERFQLVQLARRRLRETRGRLSIPELARELAVSERNLYRAFQACLGMGPREVEQLRRLHEFRARLTRGPGRTRVAEAAAEAHFTHLGRLSRLYRAHFGERPSETLRRHVSGKAQLR